jgi:NADH-quinone oxidoreductase subunit M
MLYVRCTFFTTTLFFFFKICYAIHLFLVNNYAILRAPLALHFNSFVSPKTYTIALLDFDYTFYFNLDGFSVYFLLLTTLIFVLIAIYELFDTYIPYNIIELKQYYKVAYQQDLNLLKQKNYLNFFKINYIFKKEILSYSELEILLEKKYQIYFEIQKQANKILHLFSFFHSPLSTDKINLFIIYLFIEWFICLSFLTQDLLFFYIVFECSIIPMLLLIGLKGSRTRKIRAVYLFFLYTFIGSLFMLSALIIIYNKMHTFNILILMNLDKLDLFSPLILKYLWFAIFITFAFKIPLMPFHLWLPEAHVEASTSGSVILAALLLKLGFYGMLRFLIPMFPNITLFFLPMVQTIAIISIIFSAIIALRQTDIKRIIAYSSINHMAFGLLGLFSLNATGLKGSILLMISHGFVSAALFFCIGFLYKRTHTRIITQYSGITTTMPLFIIFFGIFIFSNMGFPGTLSFIAELGIIFGICHNNLIFGIICIINLFFVTIFSIILFNKVAFNSFKIQNLNFYNIFMVIKDLSKMEFLILFILTYYIIRYGIKPDSLFSLITPDITKFLIKLKY